MPAFKTETPSIYWRYAKDGSKRYDVYFQRITRTFKREGDAKKWKRQMELRKDQGDCPTSDKRTFAQYLAEWLELKAKGAVIDRNLRRKPVGPRTLFDYQRLARDWIIEPTKQLPPVGKVRIDRVTDRTLEQLYKVMEQYTTTGTLQKLNRFLGQAFADAVKKGILGRNPAEWANVSQVDASKPKSDEDDDGAAQAMTDEEAESFLTAARAIADEQERVTDVVPPIPERCWSALWHILAGCGLRPGEALALRWQDVDEVGQKFNVRKNLIRVPGTKGYQLLKPKTKKSKRDVPIPSPVWEELKKWRKVQRRQRFHAKPGTWQVLDFILTNSKGGPLHGARRSFERVCSKAGLGEWGEQPKREHVTGPLATRQFIPGFRIYDLRHTYVTLLLMAGTPVNVVADLVGHEKASFTIARYGHALPKQTKQAVATLEAMLFRKIG